MQFLLKNWIFLHFSFGHFTPNLPSFIEFKGIKVLKYIPIKYILLKYGDLHENLKKMSYFSRAPGTNRRFLKIFQRNAPLGAKFLRFPPSDGLRDTLKRAKIFTHPRAGGGSGPPRPPPPGYAPASLHELSRSLNKKSTIPFCTCTYLWDQALKRRGFQVYNCSCSVVNIQQFLFCQHFQKVSVGLNKHVRFCEVLGSKNKQVAKVFALTY